MLKLLSLPFTKMEGSQRETFILKRIYGGREEGCCLVALVIRGPGYGRVGSNDTFGFASAYGFNSHGGTATAFGNSYSIGDKFVKALLSSSDGHGLRCDLRGQGASSGGICVDDGGKVYDVILVRK